MSITSPIIVALDFESDKEALALVRLLPPDRCRLKVGSILFTRYGPSLVKELQKEGFEIFLDLKFHDIPNTVARACSAAAELGVWMVTLHLLGGKPMLERARSAVKACAFHPHLIGVTILTHFDEPHFQEVGFQESISDVAKRLASLAFASGLGGVVSSPHEIKSLRASHPRPFLLVVPGIRPQSFQSKMEDQARIATPAQALLDGADYLVIGRPITEARNPLDAFKRIEEECKNAYSCS